MDTIFVKKYVAKGELPTANGWYTIKFSNSGTQSIEQLRFDISRKKFHDDDSDFDHVEYWLDEMTLSQYLSSMLPTGEITTTHFSHILFSDSEYKVRDCFALAEQMTAKALEKRDLEWWMNCILNDAVAPNPHAGKNWLATSNSYHEKLIRGEYEAILLPTDDQILKLANDYCQIGDGSTVTQDKVNWRNILQNGMTMLRDEIQRKLDKK